MVVVAGVVVASGIVGVLLLSGVAEVVSVDVVGLRRFGRGEVGSEGGLCVGEVVGWDWGGGVVGWTFFMGIELGG